MKGPKITEGMVELDEFFKFLGSDSLAQQVRLASRFFDELNKLEDVEERLASTCSILLTAAESELCDISEGERSEEELREFSRHFAWFNRRTVSGLMQLAGYDDPIVFVTDLFDLEEKKEEEE